MNKQELSRCGVGLASTALVSCSTVTEMPAALPDGLEEYTPTLYADSSISGAIALVNQVLERGGLSFRLKEASSEPAPWEGDVECIEFIDVHLVIPPESAEGMVARVPLGHRLILVEAGIAEQLPDIFARDMKTACVSFAADQLLAVVLLHECGHIVHRDYERTVPSMIGDLIPDQRAERQEIEDLADAFAAHVLKTAVQAGGLCEAEPLVRSLVRVTEECFERVGDEGDGFIFESHPLRADVYLRFLKMNYVLHPSDELRQLIEGLEVGSASR